MIHSQNSFTKPFIVSRCCIDLAILANSANVILGNFVLFNGNIPIRPKQEDLVNQIIRVSLICLSLFVVYGCIFIFFIFFSLVFIFVDEDLKQI